MEYWNHAVIHARWISDGKGGNVNCQNKLTEAKAKLELIKELLKEEELKVNKREIIISFKKCGQ